MQGLQVQNRGKVVEVIACDECGCTWLAKLKTNRFTPVAQTVSMEPQSIHFEADFNLLLCAGCGKIIFPPVEHYRTASLSYKLYNEMSEEIAGSKDKADERRMLTTVDKLTKGVYNHIIDKRDAEKE